MLAIRSAQQGRGSFRRLSSAKYFDGGYDGHLTLTPDGIGFRADCVVHLDSGATLQSSAQGGDATSAYEIMALNIEKRLRRYNRKLKIPRQRRRG